MAAGRIIASYNALNQPIAIWSPAYQGTSNYMWFGYDPLGGREAVGGAPSSAASSNPATYLYYNGWNVIQEGTSAPSATMLYVHGARMDEIVKQIRVSDGWERYFQHDARGNCILQTEAPGTWWSNMTTTPSGSPISTMQRETRRGTPPGEPVSLHRS